VLTVACTVILAGMLILLALQNSDTQREVAALREAIVDWLAEDAEEQAQDASVVRLTAERGWWRHWN